jgi:hypothetical protein
MKFTLLLFYCMILFTSCVYVVYGTDEPGCTGLAAKYPDVIGCKVSTLQGLNFCSFMNGMKTDEGFNTQTTLTNGQPYAEYFDKFLENAFSDLKNRISNIQAKRGGSVCQPCLDKLKVLMCANTFPAPGLRSCLVNNVLSELITLDEKCGTKICGCPEDGLCAIRKNGDLCKVNIPTSFKSIMCLVNKLPNVPDTVKKCNKYFTPVDQCIETMSSCGCVDKTQVKSMCSIFFSPDGIQKVDLPAGDCTSSSAWCGSLSKRRVISYSKPSTSSNSILGASLLQGLKSIGHTTEGIVSLLTNQPSTQTGTVNQQLVCPHEDLCIGNPSPPITPTVNGAIDLATGKTNSQSFAQSLVCEGTNSCPKGCTNVNALAFNSNAKLADDSCKNDPLVWLTWGKRSLPWIIAVSVIVVIIILCAIIGLITACCCCCCRFFRKPISY